MRGNDSLPTGIFVPQYVCTEEMATSGIFIKSVLKEMGRRILTLVTEKPEVVPA